MHKTSSLFVHSRSQRFASQVKQYIATASPKVAQTAADLRKPSVQTHLWACGMVLLFLQTTPCLHSAFIAAQKCSLACTVTSVQQALRAGALELALQLHRWAQMGRPKGSEPPLPFLSVPFSAMRRACFAAKPALASAML